ncbi:MAG: DNA-3-methyladenine glycosylase [Lentimicrobiaceae bacterium]|nr:DNA-3-methyladenine glycosylase [Lentimicrobiaceae bacterium]
MKLNRDFYLRDGVVQIAKDLLGKKLVTCFTGETVSAIITETEAYKGIVDRASHSYGGRYTPCTKIMYQIGGTAYIYRCYGIHSLFNVVTNKEGIPDAVLIRAVQFSVPNPIVVARNQGKNITKQTANGPGKLSVLLGIHSSQSGEDLLGNRIWIESTPLHPDEKSIITSPRIGISYAGEDALLPWRFIYKI